jgi:uncharacterized membrane-anchored protein YhcB (DUF1043 family)
MIFAPEAIQVPLVIGIATLIGMIVVIVDEWRLKREQQQTKDRLGEASFNYENRRSGISRW